MRLTLTLTRWHKAVERINDLIKEQTGVVESAWNKTTISYWNRLTAAKTVQARATDADLAFGQIRQELACVTVIRQALAKQNAETGVTGILAEVEALNREIQLLKTVLAGQNTDMVDPDQLASLPDVVPGDEASTMFGRRGATITVRLLPLARAEALHAELRELQARAHGLLDNVSDLNREKLTLDLPDEIARLAGLA